MQYLKMEMAHFSDTSANLFQTSWRHIDTVVSFRIIMITSDFTEILISVVKTKKGSSVGCFSASIM
jgi:hypothetical protein